ncbi:MAG: ankyrin repeat domain-containing protein, partial [Firmicutes bacterium]|nr:ankyrin repeat domain-containing protein [Bacillota bacterium]
MKKLKADIKNLVLNNKADELKSLWDNSKESLMQFCPLHFAASAGKTDILKSLIQNGADPDMKDKFGRTPLFMAVLNNHVKISEWLLDMGASPET